MFLINSQVQQLIVIGLMAASILISGRNRSVEKQSAYECGFEPVGDARVKFDIIYYIIGILFQIFDLEIILLFPFALVFFQLSSLFAFLLVLAFLVILTFGFIYEWSVGALEII